MHLSLNNKLSTDKIHYKNLEKKNYFIEEFENHSFFKKIFDKNYFKRYKFEKLVNKKNKIHVFGMGGSSLSSKMLMQFLKPANIDHRLFIYDNPYDELIIKKLDNHKISNFDKFIFISKSGKTLETSYFLEFVCKYLKTKKIKNFKKNFIFITENSDNFLKNYAIKNNILTFEHDHNIGGRFSIFSITGLLPLALLGYPIKNIIKSSKSAFAEFRRDREKICKYLFNFYFYQKKSKSNIFVGFSYNEKLTTLNEWYRQIFAESLGKNKNSITYISSLGSIDQHSQFQLYIDGPNDKSYIFFILKNKNKQKSLLDILQKGAIKTLSENKPIIGEIIIDNNLKDYTKLIITLIYDIFLRAKIENINFLNQPAVEKLKKNIKIKI